MSAPHDVVFLVDCDNTLLDNDSVQESIKAYLLNTFGEQGCERYWQIYHELFDQLGYADYLGAVQRFRLERLDDPRVTGLAEFLLNFPYPERLYPGALDAVRHLAQWGPVVVLSDGDGVFQPRKIDRSGIAAAVEQRVLIYVHKEEMLAHVERLYPAKHYVMVDDKLRVLDAMKAIWKERLTTVFPRQGHYAFDPKILSAHRAADVTVERIGDLLELGLPALLKA
jgi:FMN phosphatase YigB (HAD superfamily)